MAPLRYPYKVLPLTRSHAAFPDEKTAWMPLLPVQLSYGHGRKTPRIEALIDSGAADCLFRADMCPYLGIKLDNGIHSTTGGIVPGEQIDVYFHDVSLWIGFERIRIKVGFAERMTVAAILGRRGFFENFTVTFDPANNPPGFTIERLHRA